MHLKSTMFLLKLHTGTGGILPWMTGQTRTLYKAEQGDCHLTIASKNQHPCQASAYTLSGGWPSLAPLVPGWDPLQPVSFWCVPWYWLIVPTSTCFGHLHTLMGQSLLKCKVFPHLKHWLGQVAASLRGWGGIDFILAGALRLSLRAFSSCCIWLLRSPISLYALVSFLLSVTSPYLSAMVLTASCLLGDLLCQDCRSISSCWQPSLPASVGHQKHTSLPFGLFPITQMGDSLSIDVWKLGKMLVARVSIRSVHCLRDSPLLLVADWKLSWCVRSSAEEPSALSNFQRIFLKCRQGG